MVALVVLVAQMRQVATAVALVVRSAALVVQPAALGLRLVLLVFGLLHSWNC